MYVKSLQKVECAIIKGLAKKKKVECALSLLMYTVLLGVIRGAVY